MGPTWYSSLLLAVLALAAIATCVNSEQDDKISDDVSKRSVDEEALAAASSDDLDMDEDEKRSRLFRYGRGGLMRYGKRSSVFRYGKRAPAVFRYGKRADENDELSAEEMDGVKRLFRWGKRSDLSQDYVKRLFRWGKRALSEDDLAALVAEDEGLEDDDAAYLDNEKRAVFRYGKRVPSGAADTKRRVFRFGKRAGYEQGDFKYGRDTRVPDAPHVPFRFGDE